MTARFSDLSAVGSPETLRALLDALNARFFLDNPEPRKPAAKGARK